MSTLTDEFKQFHKDFLEGKTDSTLEDTCKSLEGKNPTETATNIEAHLSKLESTELLKNLITIVDVINCGPNEEDKPIRTALFKYQKELKDIKEFNKPAIA